MELGTDWFDYHGGIQSFHSRILRIKDKEIDYNDSKINLQNICILIAKNE